MDLWMANGFISSSETLEAEDISDKVWNELYWRSFFQDIKADEFGKIKSFRMHDLAESVTQEVCCITDDNGITNVTRETRHLSIYSEELLEKENSIRLLQVRSLKTFLGPGNYWDGQFPLHVLKRYSLRVLYFPHLQTLPTTIGDLKYLRYLNISGGKFKTLPESICKLRNLQVLLLEDCYYLETLLDSMKQLKALRHLYLKGCRSLLSMPGSIGELSSLKTLSIFVVGKGTGYSLTELGTLKLKGELHIKHLERVASVEDAEEANMGDKHLHELVLSWDRDEESKLQGKDVERVLEVLQPSTHHLQILKVEGYPGVQFPQSMISPSLKVLCNVVLVDCKNCSSLPPLWKLPSLKRLEISNMNHVKYLVDETYDNTGDTAGFVALKLLILENLPKLMGLTREEEESMFPNLSELQICECPELSLSSLPSLKALNVKGKYYPGLSSICCLHNLELLHFCMSDSELTCFPNGLLKGLASLKTLWIDSFSRLEAITNETINLSAIQELCIASCDSLESLTDSVLEGLQSLKVFKIEQNSMFRLSAGFQHLTCLRQLDIVDCPGVEDFPEALQHMTALKSLTVFDLQNLKSLPDWLGNLVLLESLVIVGCPELKILPTSIHSLCNLTYLSIGDCGELSKRCERGTGQDWPLIAHVPTFDDTPPFHYVGGISTFFRIHKEGDIVNPVYLACSAWVK